MDTIRCTVIGANEIAGVATGGTVELDPAEVNIDALVQGGHIRPPKRASKPGAAAESGKGGD